MEVLSKYRNFYKISKTLRFELKPIGKTLKNFQQNRILEGDEEKHNLSFELKKLLDEFYKIQIDLILNKNILPKDLLMDYAKSLDEKENIDKTVDILKRYVIDAFKEKNILYDNKEDNVYKMLTSEKVINYLKKYLEEQNRKEEVEIISKFKGYSTYFTDFFKNRKHCFIGSSTGSISYRLIDENLNIYNDNIKIYEKLKGFPIIEKIKGKLENETMFKIENYNEVLTQKGIDKYNNFINGFTKSEDNKVQGLNELINSFNQTNKTKLPLFKNLNKQILSDHETSSFVYESIESDLQVKEIIDNYLEENEFINIFNSDEIDLNKVMLKNGMYITILSQKIYKDWNEINNKINKWYEENIDSNIKRKTYIKKRTMFLKSKKYFSFGELNKILDINILEIISEIINDHIKKIQQAVLEYENINFSEINNLKKSSSLEQIKTLLDSIKEYQSFLKQFWVGSPEIDKDPVFYSQFDRYYKKIIEIIPIYNKVRNYVTKKPYDISKIKLKFNKPTLLDGWDINKENSNLGIILKKYNNKRNKYDYYLGILNDTKIFNNVGESKSNDYFEKMEYKLFPGANKMLPKMFITAKKYRESLPSDFLESYESGKHTKQNLDKKFLTEYISYMQTQLKKYYKDDFNFNFRQPQAYNQIDEFYREVEMQGYNIKFKRIDTSYINECIENDKLYLFQIYSKDFSEHSEGLPNLHTIYLENLFTEENLIKKVFKLNGNAEMFYRKASLDYRVTHKKGEELINKNVNNNKKTSVFNYDLIKDKRFTIDKFLFHFPITINFNSLDIKNINQYINNNIGDFEHVIGIDRGERNLIYIVVTDLNGKLIKQISLNAIVNNYNNNQYTTDYHQLLDKREKALTYERQSWKNIETIKELKEGYISQVVNKIKELVLKYNAVVVLENLNYGFKNSRIKIEKQVYQKLETQLIQKFNYIIDKSKPETYLNGLQLTNPITTLEKIGSQTGIIFYIPAWNTSRIDPTTGFVNLIYGLKYTNRDAFKDFISKIKDIRYNNEYYEFDVDFKDFNSMYHDTKTNWTLCTYGNRVVTYRDKDGNNNWVSKEIDLTTEFNNLFNKYNIIDNFKETISNVDEPKFCEEFIRLFKLMLQIRNSVINSEIDYMISPVKNNNNNFFDTRESNPLLPKDADANGAYNIARKGIILIKRIKNSKPGEKIDYKITNEEYLKCLQNVNF